MTSYSIFHNLKWLINEKNYVMFCMEKYISMKVIDWHTLTNLKAQSAQASSSRTSSMLAHLQSPLGPFYNGMVGTVVCKVPHTSCPNPCPGLTLGIQLQWQWHNLEASRGVCNQERGANDQVTLLMWRVTSKWENMMMQHIRVTY